MKAFPCVLLALLWVNSLAVASKPAAQFTLRHTKNGPVHVIIVNFVDDDGGPLPEVIHLGEGSPDKSEGYELRVKTDGTDSPLPVQAKAMGVAHGYASGIELTADREHTFSSANDYYLRIKGGTIFLKENGTNTSFNGGASFDLELDKDLLKEDEDYVSPKGLEKKFEILGGTGGGNGSFRYFYEKAEINGRGWLNLKAEAKGDFNFLNKNREEYFNNLTGELKLFYPFRWNFPGTPAGESLKRARQSELDVHLRVDSDQKFENADKVIGTSIATYLKDPLSKWFTSFHPLNGFKKSQEASVSPLLILGYDYADELKTKDDSTTEKLDTHAGNHRLRTTLYWSLPLGRELDWGFIGVKTRVDVDALLELSGIYDFRADKFLDQSRASLNFTPRTAKKTHVAYTLSWERGKAAPTFNDVHALLVGLKVNY